jgi:hypothetical protein
LDPVPLLCARSRPGCAGWARIWIGGNSAGASGTGPEESLHKDLVTDSETERYRFMLFHTRQSQYNAKLDTPDPIFARQMQELIGGQWGEMSVMMGYLLRGWDCRELRGYPSALQLTSGS